MEILPTYFSSFSSSDSFSSSNTSSKIIFQKIATDGNENDAIGNIYQRLKCYGIKEYQPDYNKNQLQIFPYGFKTILFLTPVHTYNKESLMIDMMDLEDILKIGCRAAYSNHIRSRNNDRYGESFDIIHDVMVKFGEELEVEMSFLEISCGVAKVTGHMKVVKIENRITNTLKHVATINASFQLHPITRENVCRGNYHCQGKCRSEDVEKDSEEIMIIENNTNPGIPQENQENTRDIQEKDKVLDAPPEDVSEDIIIIENDREPVIPQENQENTKEIQEKSKGQDASPEDVDVESAESQSWPSDFFDELQQPEVQEGRNGGEEEGCESVENDGEEMQVSGDENHDYTETRRHYQCIFPIAPYHPRECLHRNIPLQREMQKR
ncbi:hypothetical protein B9Z55_002672 [Caenorhabditis nigoni]|uniref:Uncharacterized protein n=1 Tax=Caenorhabditis nigoni TaxID=1611254 RepID=A0A2G5VLJ3_9PELO|nr:hypothetical protein B9Z55_002672 [Caenorhabditis nigoni]